jgi:hypothetical protein
LEETREALAQYAVIDAGINSIETTGCNQLSKGHWPALKSIILCNSAITKTAIVLMMRAARVSTRQTGSRGQTST